MTELTETHGMTQPQIAAVCDCAQSSISAIARGETKDPRHSVGESLKALRDAKRREAAERGVLSPPPSNQAGAAGVAAARG